MKKSSVKYRTNLTKNAPKWRKKRIKAIPLTAKMLLEDVNDLFGLELDDSQCDTIGGLGLHAA